MGHKVIAINQWWAGVLAALMASAIIGGVAAYAQQQVTQNQVQDLKEANLPERMTRIEETVKNTAKDVENINRKIDFLVQQQVRDDSERRQK